VRIAREGLPLDFYRALGEQCLANYYDEHYPFDRDETLALEEHLGFEIGGGYALQGFVDRIARARDGAIEIQDYKTSARVPSQAGRGRGSPARAVPDRHRRAIRRRAPGPAGLALPAAAAHARLHAHARAARRARRADARADRPDPQRDGIRAETLGAVPLVRVPRGLPRELRAARGSAGVRAARCRGARGRPRRSFP
jgi:hypothetical protein